MYKVCKIIQNRKESNSISTLFFDEYLKAKPGQFAMAWLPGVNEKPFSLSYDNAITVKEVGDFTSRLIRLKEGDKLWLRGPYGKGFPVKNNYLLIGGGVGIAPLRLLAEKAGCKTILLGGRCKEDVLFVKEFQQFADVLITTEDGSLGVKGLITDLLPVEADYAAICGPEKMMVECLKRTGMDKNKVFLSLERYMKCGIGLCGHCSCSGFRVCVDGPIFSGKEVMGMKDFGVKKRLKSGRWGLV